MSNPIRTQGGLFFAEALYQLCATKVEVYERKVTGPEETNTCGCKVQRHRDRKKSKAQINHNIFLAQCATFLSSVG